MIQRIQSLYMLLSVVACVVCLASPIAHFSTQEVVPVGDLYNLWLSVPSDIAGEVQHQLTPWVALFALLALVSTFTLLNIFLYQKRSLQMRVLIYSMIVLVGYYIVGGIFVWRLCSEYDFSVRPTVFGALPLVGLILDYLAFRGVHKDDSLVRSLDRLR